MRDTLRKLAQAKRALRTISHESAACTALKLLDEVSRDLYRPGARKTEEPRPLPRPEGMLGAADQDPFGGMWGRGLEVDTGGEW